MAKTKITSKEALTDMTIDKTRFSIVARRLQAGIDISDAHAKTSTKALMVGIMAAFLCMGISPSALAAMTDKAAISLVKSAVSGDASALTSLRNAAMAGDPVAQNGLGAYWLMKKDGAKGVSWFRKAAEQGFAEAQCNLGVAYANGQGVPKDYAKAISWTRKAAEQGLAETKAESKAKPGQRRSAACEATAIA